MSKRLRTRNMGQDLWAEGGFETDFRDTMPTGNIPVNGIPGFNSFPGGRLVLPTSSSPWWSRGRPRQIATLLAFVTPETRAP
jgi:hypothetical protein